MSKIKKKISRRIFNIRFELAMERISELEDSSIGILQSRHQKAQGE